MPEVDLMKRYPKSNRKKLLEDREQVTAEESVFLRTFPKEYFDGTRKQGYGGYNYNSKFFTPVVEDMISYYNLSKESKILDVGCAKGFMLYDFTRLLPGVKIAGIDISDYALDNAIDEVKPFLKKASCNKLPYDDNSFDLVISIATIHNLDIEGVKRSLKEIMRVTKKHAYIKVNAHENEEERIAFQKWNVVARTSLYKNEWIKLFDEVGYTGDYSWFKPCN